MTQDKTPELKVAIKALEVNFKTAEDRQDETVWLLPIHAERILDYLTAEAQEQKGETIDTFKLPFDVQLGNNTFGKGVSFKTYAAAANRYYGYAIEKPTPEPQEQKGCVAHAWPNLDKSTDRKCMTCGMIERDDIRQKQAEAFKNIPTPEPQGAEVAEAFEVIEAMDCSCSVKERMSGHRTECNMPQVGEAISVLKAATRQQHGRVDALVKALETLPSNRMYGAIKSSSRFTIELGEWAFNNIDALRAFKGE